MGADQVDIEREGGVVRQLQYEDGGLVVFDASAEAVAANWTTLSSPSQFVRLVAAAIDLNDADITLSLSQRGLVRMSADRLTYLIDNEGVQLDSTCKFIRLDLSWTQSAMWQLMSPDGMVLAGFGDNPTHFLDEKQEPFAHHLVNATVHPPNIAEEVLDQLRGFSKQFYSGYYDRGPDS